MASTERRLTDLREQLEKTLGDSYAIERELGGAGMSRVFVAHETTLDRKVVIKVLPSELAVAVSVERFKREIQVAAKLQHPNIVPVLTSGVSDGLPYYTMPFVEGESLRSRLRREGELPVADALTILCDVLSALSYAHEHGIVHRDIKPDNVLLTKYNAVVADFGIAKALTASAGSAGSLTSLGIALGTPAYMAPEQVSADPMIDHRADIYSVGAMAYEMLSGSPLFGSRSAQSTMAAHAIEEPEPLEKKRRSVAVELSTVIMRALEKRAADRPQTAEQMLRDLESVAAPASGSRSPIAHRRSATTATLSKTTTVAALGIALLVLIVVAFSWVTRKPASLQSVEAPRIAVLPFDNGGAPGDAYFSEGMTEAITNRLASISGMTVVGRQSAKGYARSSKTPQQIGAEMGVSYLLTGSVRWDKSQKGRSLVSIRPALLRTSDGTQMWSEPYEAVLAGEFKVQSDVAERVAQALDVTLLPHESRALEKPPTNSPAAYDDYLRGRFFWNKRTVPDYATAITYFKKAIARDSLFARAYAGAADTYLLRGYDDAGRRDQDSAELFAHKAIALDSTLGGPRVTLGSLLVLRHSWSEAEREYRHAIALEPSYATIYHRYSRLLLTRGKFKEAVATAAKARALDPLSAIINANLAMIQLGAGNYLAADTAARLAMELDRTPVIRWVFSVVLITRRDYRTAIAQLDTAIRFNDGEWDTNSRKAFRAYALKLAGDSSTARSTLRRLRSTPESGVYWAEIALLHIGLGESDSAAVWLSRHIRNPGGELVPIRWPFFDSIVTDPRVQAAVRESIDAR
jgi:eukaryotic-like serine/threonine-protein kinase